MMLVSRHNSILDIARETGKVEVDELATRFSVSPQTIRKDLKELSDQGLLTRVHGGALLAFGVENLGYSARKDLAGKEKEIIGQAAADLIPDRASLFVNIGTTTEAVARALIQRSGLMIITNNLNVASTLRPFSENEVIISGGLVRATDGGIVGEAAADFIRQFKVDYAVIGVSALDRDGALLDYDYREVRVAQAIIENARHVILVADQTKFERSAPVRIGHIAQVDTFVTDTLVSQDYRQLLADNEVRLVEVAGKAQQEPGNGSRNTTEA
ncbi:MULTISPECIES: DeoR/GlpR family DNA-binding transcription regulator [Pseudovibrio]|jgi:DeoR family glycerol-3-phosphate regulon repressor|uniref:Transcriptional regulator, DeoR family n=1 Tax=Pseudovibrio ascidiaceicola TaxID=285279 RepID=A0A1I4AMP6_9HYPH|nr:MULTISPECIES: DeoR/GlpR family DNA-binding transcription regulator [Pseudovibrio]KZK98352.1 Glycerol-3-phosphate regulon repressor [Pseudovibrio sp. Ad26]SFK57654.1 transcriptional regulator, DeoR family [Pseudovibrio ascidiaceicola]